MNPRIDRALLDDDQGVDDLGHPCRLELRSVGWVRTCAETHEFGEPYRGMPLGRLSLTTNELDIATDHGADELLVQWLRDELANRQLTVRVVAYNDRHDRRFAFGSGSTTDEAVAAALETIRTRDEDDSFEMDDWSAA